VILKNETRVRTAPSASRNARVHSAKSAAYLHRNDGASKETCGRRAQMSSDLGGIHDGSIEPAAHPVRCFWAVQVEVQCASLEIAAIFLPMTGAERRKHQLEPLNQPQ
jgi:hypothetical protein